MLENDEKRLTLGEKAARQLSTTTKTQAQWGSITPRWLCRFLSWTPVESGVYRVNRVRSVAGDLQRDVDANPRAAQDLAQLFIDYNEKPREHVLSAITSILDVQTRISDLYRSPWDEVQEQLRLLIERVKEKQEDELLYNDDYGLIVNAPPAQRLRTRKGPPMPDDMDELIARVWKEPSFFLAHPKAIAAFGRECTRRGVPPPTVSLFGSPFLTWRGIPLVPCDKLRIDNEGRTSILLLRTGEKRQGVVGLFQPGLPGEVQPSLSVRFMGIDRKAIASYLISLYCSAAILTDDAIAVLDDVDVGNFYDYPM
jgi:Phage capsid-like protein